MKRIICSLLILLMVFSPFILNLRGTLAQQPQFFSFSLSDFQHAFGSTKGVYPWHINFQWNPAFDLNKDGIVDMRDIANFSRNYPIIMKVWDNLNWEEWLPDSGIPIFNATVKNADQCVISYMYQYDSYVSDWMNVTMMKQGDNYGGTIDSSSMPTSEYTTVTCQIYSMNVNYITVKYVVQFFNNVPIIV